jgi:UDP-N-acetylmuramoyl-tripeptide--D-alanyl-D-alanine ligase
MNTVTLNNTKPIPWKGFDILDATKGDLLFGNIRKVFSGISIDSRSISHDELFVAVRGRNYDGFSFAGDAIKKGVKGILINAGWSDTPPFGEWSKKGIVCIVVNDTIKALGDLALFNRKRAKVSVIAITGSNGKTTTKDMTASVVAEKFCTLSTTGNLNNGIGLPLTILKLCPCHEWAVLELGMNRPGEIARLGDICLPDLGIITNIKHAHLEGLGSIENIMHATGELLSKISESGVAVLNADDQRVLGLADKFSNNILFYGLSAKADIRAESVSDKKHGVSFRLILPGKSVDVNLRVFGDFMVSNALAAAAAGYSLGESILQIKEGLEDFQPPQGRMNIFETSGIHIIDDTYNANPDSMKVAIMTFRSLKKRSRGAIVISDMLELGEFTESMHRDIGSLSAGSDIARLYITGDFAGSVASGAREQNSSLNIFTGTREEIIEDLTKWLKHGDWVLIKGSRATGMEKIVEGLKSDAKIN